jgi:hypothetical protein
MSNQAENRWAISPDARGKCIERARKAVRIQDRYGRWLGYGNSAMGILLVGLSVVWYVAFERFVRMDAFQPQAVQNLAWQGFLLGLVFGAVAGVTTLIGVTHILEGVKCLRGDPTDRMLVEYHDAMLELAHEQTGEESQEPNAPGSNESPTGDELPHEPIR